MPFNPPSSARDRRGGRGPERGGAGSRGAEVGEARPLFELYDNLDMPDDLYPDDAEDLYRSEYISILYLCKVFHLYLVVVNELKLHHILAQKCHSLH